MDKIFEKKVVFVDCFNTLLLRKRSAKEVIFEFCKLLGDKHDIEPAFLFNHFISTKNKLVVSNFLKFGEGECAFSGDIVDKFVLKVCDCENISQFKADCVELYIQAETQNLMPNESLVEELRKRKEVGLKSYLVSDFYCEKEMMQKLLQNFALSELFDDIFVSCDHLASKRSGALFQKALESLHLSPSQVVMIGDNEKADVRGARKCKISSIKLDVKKVKSAKNFKKRTKFGYNYDKLLDVAKEFPEQNFSNFAFPLYLFIKRLHQQLQERGTKDVFFLAREGQFLMKLYQTYCSILGEKEPSPAKRGGGKERIIFSFPETRHFLQA